MLDVCLRAQELLARMSGQQLQQLEEASGSLANTSRGYVTAALPDKLVRQVCVGMCIRVICEFHFYTHIRMLGQHKLGSRCCCCLARQACAAAYDARYPDGVQHSVQCIAQGTLVCLWAAWSARV